MRTLFSDKPIFPHQIDSQQPWGTDRQGVAVKGAVPVRVSIALYKCLKDP
jgi:hypothetical protein